MYGYFVPFTVYIGPEVKNKNGYVRVYATHDGKAVTAAHRKLGKIWPGKTRLIHTPKIVKF